MDLVHVTAGRRLGLSGSCGKSSEYIRSEVPGWAQYGGPFGPGTEAKNILFHIGGKEPTRVFLGAWPGSSSVLTCTELLCEKEEVGSCAVDSGRYCQE